MNKKSYGISHWQSEVNLLLRDEKTNNLVKKLISFRVDPNLLAHPSIYLIRNMNDQNFNEKKNFFRALIYPLIDQQKIFFEKNDNYLFPMWKEYLGWRFKCFEKILSYYDDQNAKIY